MPFAREHHREPSLVGGGNHFRVAHRSTGLDNGGRAGVGYGIEPVAEREEGVRRGNRSRQRAGRAFITATFTASTRLICPAPIASVRSAPVKIMAFDFTCPQTRQAKRSACHSSAVGCALGHDLRHLGRAATARGLRDTIALLHQHAAEERARARARVPSSVARLAKSAVTTRRFGLASPGSLAPRRRRPGR